MFGMRASFREGETADEAEEEEAAQASENEEEEGRGEAREEEGKGATSVAKATTKRIIGMPLDAWAYAFIPRIRSGRLKLFTLLRRGTPTRLTRVIRRRMLLVKLKMMMAMRITKRR